MGYIIIATLFAIASAVIATNKNRSGFGWFILGFILGPFGLIVAFLPALEDPLYKYIKKSSNKEVTQDIFTKHTGKFLSYHPQTGKGIIMLADKRKIDFDIRQWDDPELLPEVGMNELNIYNINGTLSIMSKSHTSKEYEDFILAKEKETMSEASEDIIDVPEVDEHEVKIAVLMKEPYVNLGKTLHMNLVLRSPIYAIYEFLLEHGLKKESERTFGQLTMKQLSDISTLRSIIQTQEDILLQYIVSFVQSNRKRLSSLDPNLPAEIFSLDADTLDFLKTKVASFSTQFLSDIQQLDEKMQVFTKHNTIDQEVILRKINGVIHSQPCYKKIENTCLLSALNIIIETNMTKSKDTFDAFSAWSRQYDKVYLESLKKYRRPLDTFYNDIISVIIHNYEQSHTYFMKDETTNLIQNEAKKGYIEYIKKSIDQDYSDTELLEKQKKVENLNKLLT